MCFRVFNAVKRHHDYGNSYEETFNCGGPIAVSAV